MARIPFVPDKPVSVVVLRPRLEALRDRTDQHPVMVMASLDIAHMSIMARLDMDAASVQSMGSALSSKSQRKQSETYHNVAHGGWRMLKVQSSPTMGLFVAWWVEPLTTKPLVHSRIVLATFTSLFFQYLQSPSIHRSSIAQFACISLLLT